MGDPGEKKSGSTEKAGINRISYADYILRLKRTIQMAEAEMNRLPGSFSVRDRELFNRIKLSVSKFLENPNFPLSAEDRAMIIGRIKEINQMAAEVKSGKRTPIYRPELARPYAAEGMVDRWEAEHAFGFLEKLRGERQTEEKIRLQEADFETAVSAVQVLEEEVKALRNDPNPSERNLFLAHIKEREIEARNELIGFVRNSAEALTADEIQMQKKNLAYVLFGNEYLNNLKEGEAISEKAYETFIGTAAASGALREFVGSHPDIIRDAVRSSVGREPKNEREKAFNEYFAVAKKALFHVVDDEAKSGIPVIAEEERNRLGAVVLRLRGNLRMFSEEGDYEEVNGAQKPRSVYAQFIERVDSSFKKLYGSWNRDEIYENLAQLSADTARYENMILYSPDTENSRDKLDVIGAFRVYMERGNFETPFNPQDPALVNEGRKRLIAMKAVDAKLEKAAQSGDADAIVRATEIRSDPEKLRQAILNYRKQPDFRKIFDQPGVTGEGLVRVLSRNGDKIAESISKKDITSLISVPENTENTKQRNRGL